MTSARLPDLVIVGAPKAGTTTLSRWLRTHPQVAVSTDKELCFFDQHYDRGLGWYLDRLPQDPGDRVVVEATPTYLSDPHAGERIARDLPGARFVAVLREPVARAWSQYWFFVQLGVERRPWQRALEEERDGEGHGYLWRSRYGAQLARWQGLVGPERLHVVLLDDLGADPDGTYAGLCAFAGVEPRPAPGKGAVNPTRLPRSATAQRLLRKTGARGVRRALYTWNAHGREVPRLPDAERQRLAPLFADDLQVLTELRGHELPGSWRALRPSAQS